MAPRKFGPFRSRRTKHAYSPEEDQYLQKQVDEPVPFCGSPDDLETQERLIKHNTRSSGPFCHGPGGGNRVIRDARGL